MTDIPSIPDSPDEGGIYPTKWVMLDPDTQIQYRQTTDNTYQLKSLSHILTINKEGFDLYRYGSIEDFEIWLAENHLKAEMLDYK